MSDVIAFPDENERYSINFVKSWTATLANQFGISEAQAASIVQRGVDDVKAFNRALKIRGTLNLTGLPIPLEGDVRTVAQMAVDALTHVVLEIVWDMHVRNEMNARGLPGDDFLNRSGDPEGAS